jgi:hypothetical protein
MLDIEAKTKLRASEGGHFFFTMIFLIITGKKYFMIDKSKFY